MEPADHPYSLKLTRKDRELLPLVAEAHQRRPGDLLRFLLRREAAALGIKIEDDGKLAGASASEAE
jgi:hypothetical protein